MSDVFVFTGLVPPARVPELIQASDIIVHASYWEGLARVLPQALIAGKPVVSYDVDGAREVVIPGETGYLLAAAIGRRAGNRPVRIGWRSANCANGWAARAANDSSTSSATKR